MWAYVLSGWSLQIRTMFCKNIEPQIVLINKNNLRTFEPQECQKYKNVEPQQNLSGSYKKKVYFTRFSFYKNILYKNIDDEIGQKAKNILRICSS